MTRSTFLVSTVTALSIGAFLFTSGCDSTDPEEEDFSHIQEVRISPDSVSVSVGETVDFSFILLTADGEEVEADLNTRWESTDESVFTVSSTGLATAVAPGSAKCVIEVSSYPLALTSAQVGKADTPIPLDISGFVGQDSARVVVF